MPTCSRVLVFVFLLVGALVASLHAQTPALFDIMTFGARSGTDEAQTTAIQQAIDACAAAGGGTVYVPPGVFLSGTIELASHVELYLAPGAVLKGSPRLADYRRDTSGRVMETPWLGLIYATGANHVSITGRGTIDGNGTSFMQLDVQHVGADYDARVTRQGRDFMDPRFGTADGPVKPRERPGNLIVLAGGEDILVDGVTLADSPTWTLHIAEANGVTVRGIRVVNNLLVPNSDGIHCTCSRNVHISDCDISAGDDAIAISGLRLGGERASATENVTVTNCTLASRSAGIRVGYGENPIRNVVVRGVTITGSNRGIGVFSRDAAPIENVLFSDVVIETRLHTGHWWGKGEPLHVSALPRTTGVPAGLIRDVRFVNVLAHAETGALFYGTADAPIEGLVLDNVRLAIGPSPLADSYGGNFDVRPAERPELGVFKHDIPGIHAQHVRRARLRDVEVGWERGLASYFTNGLECREFEGLVIDGFRGRLAHLGATRAAAIRLAHGRDVVVSNSQAAPGTTTFLRHSDLTGTRLLTASDGSKAKSGVVPESGFDTVSVLLPE